MKTQPTGHASRWMVPSRGELLLGLLLCCLSARLPAATLATVTLADQPVFAGTNVPGKWRWTLSGGYPTANSIANLGDYADTSTYLDYFNASHWSTYTTVYSTATSDASGSYFQPASLATGTDTPPFSEQWNGNLLN